jgi:hypothetical protein
MMFVGGVMILASLAVGSSIGRLVGIGIAVLGGIFDHDRHGGPSVLESIRRGRNR